MDSDDLPPWPDLLRTPTYLVNLDRRPERLASSLHQLRAAGFADVTRFAAVDGTDPDALTAAWHALGLPPPGETWRRDPLRAAGQRGCLASHLLLWREIAEAAAPCAWVFEDDIRFADCWQPLAPIFFARSQRPWDLLYVGSHAWRDLGTAWLARVPVYCTHAYLVTREGARRLTAAIRGAPFAYPLDMMLADLQQRAIDTGSPPGFDWLVWHGRQHHHETGTGTTGLVLQDRRRFPSDIAGSG